MATTVQQPTATQDETAIIAPHPPITLRLRPVVDVTPDLLLALSSLNDELRLELTAEGELIVMAPAGGRAGRRNQALGTQLDTWAEKDGTGATFDSSTGFEIAPKVVRSPDASWVALARWDALSAEQQDEFPPLCPDFVAELRSPSDRLPTLQRKMQEYIDNGAHLGWLIDPAKRQVYVYRPDAPVEQLDNAKTVAGNPVLPGFVLDLTKIW